MTSYRGLHNCEAFGFSPVFPAPLRAPREDLLFTLGMQPPRCLATALALQYSRPCTVPFTHSEAGLAWVTTG